VNKDIAAFNISGNIKANSQKNNYDTTSLTARKKHISKKIVREPV
jgi:hypothetical protein